MGRKPQEWKVTFIGTPNYDRAAVMIERLLAAQCGVEVDVTITHKDGTVAFYPHNARV